MATPPENSSLNNQNQNASGGGGEEEPIRYTGVEARNTFQYLKKSRQGKREDDQLSPSMFQLIPPEDNCSSVQKSELYRNIQRTGGSNYPGKEMDRDIPGVIRILNEEFFVDNEEEDCVIPLDTYSSMFIYKCTENKTKGLPPPHPWKYLIPPLTTKYGSRYDARKILREELDWDDIDPLIFPPKDKQITARKWIEDLRRMKAELPRKETAATIQKDNKNRTPPSAADQNRNSNTTNTPVAVAPPVVVDVNQAESPRNNLPVASTSRGTNNLSRRRQQSKRPRPLVVSESDSDEDDLFEPYNVVKRKGIRIAARRLSSTPSSSQDAPGSSKSDQVDPVAVYSRLAQLTSKKVQLERHVPQKTTTPKSSKPSSPEQLKNGSSSKTAVAEDSGSEEETAQSSKKSSKTQTPSHKSSPSKENGESSRPPVVTTSASSSSKKATVKLSTPLPTNKVVAVAGPPNHRRFVRKPQAPPVGDNGWVNCDPSSDESVHFSENEDDDGEGDVKPQLRPFWARQYSIEEGQRLLDLVVKHDAYRYVKGNKFWKLLEASNKFKGRTFQSMRNHFLKTVVLTSIRSATKSVYKISPDNLKKLKNGVYSKVQQHAKVCPDYKL